MNVNVEEKLGGFEIAVAVVSGLIVFIATMAAPQLDRGSSRAKLSIANARQERQIAELQTTLEGAQQQSDTLQTQLSQANAQLEQASSELAVLKQRHETLSAQLVASTGKVKELEVQLEGKDQEVAGLKELMRVEKLTKERKEAEELAKAAEERAKKAEDRIRELTLQLHRAGVLP